MFITHIFSHSLFHLCSSFLDVSHIIPAHSLFAIIILQSSVFKFHPFLFIHHTSMSNQQSSVFKHHSSVFCLWSLILSLHSSVFYSYPFLFTSNFLLSFFNHQHPASLFNVTSNLYPYRFIFTIHASLYSHQSSVFKHYSSHIRL